MLYKAILASLFLSVFLVSCMAMPENNTLKKGKKRFSISPEEVTIDEAFQIHLPKLRPSRMAIKTPSNEWYIIHDADENILMLPVNEFEKSDMITIIPSTLKGVVWEDGKKRVRRVFHLPGRYVIYLADNIETEPENTFSFEGTVTLK